MNAKIVEAGDTVMISFVGRLDDGRVFDSSSEKPLSIEIGSGKLIQGLDREIVGMSEGDEKTVNVKAEEAYGIEDPKLVANIPTVALKKNNIEPVVGLMLKTPQGNCHITNVSDLEIEVNFNHPLAGKRLTFEVKIEEVIKR
ncbi:FKBP-type peptidyl-prolyl cis-trans isomerase [Desulfobacterota bacterium AH_259_B03_O07]|nr:FKBP-type peptidyl-prolyl cis-trans isomerase [Desulfobacterota bacterium AH_259_B03_O07]